MLTGLTRAKSVFAGIFGYLVNIEQLNIDSNF